MAKAGLPSDFLWGVATAAYQIEGAANEDGRGPSIWDTFCERPGKIADGSSGAVACDSYHQTAKDLALLKGIGAKAYRFSLSWSRIIPKGGRKDPVNQQGLDYYIRLLDDLERLGITPLVTLFHWDLPDELDKRYGGLLNKEEFVQDFTHYARLVFKAFGPRCRKYITFNEPWCSAILGYNVGLFAPGRTSDREKNPEGDSSREPWIVGHNILIAHGSAVKAYRDEFQSLYAGEIGITLNGDWVEPFDPRSQDDIAACERKLEFSIGWFADPIYLGDYPASMRAQLGDRLPEFAAEELALVKGSNDFYGQNHYCANYIKHRSGVPPANDFAGNLEILFEDINGTKIGPDTQSAWLKPHPQGFRKLLKWISDRYHQPRILVTENGTSIANENDKSKQEILEDDFRVAYFADYIKSMAEAYAEDKVNVRAYMAWSLMDNFEWAEGYETRFGLTYVDYEHGQTRYLKKSARELRHIMEKYIAKK